MSETPGSETSRLGTIRRYGLATAWAGAVLWSVLSLALFRSTAGHGPDMVASEAAGFLFPLLFAFALSLGFADVHKRQPSTFRFSLLVTTVVIIVVESAIFWNRIM